MNLEDAKRETLLNIEAGNATMWCSGSGMGKSSSIYDVFRTLAARGEKNEWGFGLSFAATMTPIDTLGVPFKGTHTFKLFDGTTKEITVTDPSVPLWMISTEGKPAFCYKHFFWFCDEYDKGEADTKRGLSEIFLTGGNGFWKLPPGSVRVAAMNSGSRYGSTKDFDHAIARRTLLNITRDIRGFLTWADKPYYWGTREWVTTPLTKVWASTHAEGVGSIYEPEPKEQGPWCNPRTLCAWDRYLQCKAAANGGKLNPNDSATVEMGAGTIGMPATQSYVSTMQFKLELPSYDDVITNPTECPVPKKADLLMLMAYELASWTRKEHLSEVLAYVNRMPKDMAITFGAALMRREPRFVLEPAVHAWSSKHAGLISVINSLSNN